MIKACIFDMDGTLANTLESIAYFGNKALVQCGYSSIEVEKFRYLVGNGMDRLMRGMLTTVKGTYTEEDVTRLGSVYNALYESDYMHLLQNYNGVPEMLQKLKVLGLRLAVLSNKPHNVTVMVTERLFPNGTFDLCYGQRMEIERKPSPQGALLIAEELEILPEETLYVGDTDVDMKTGNAAGMETVGVLWGFRDRKELEENHAKHLVNNAEELYKLACLLRLS